MGTINLAVESVESGFASRFRVFETVTRQLFEVLIQGLYTPQLAILVGE